MDWANFFMGDTRCLFIMGPHSNDLDGPYFFQDLVDEAALDNDAM